MLTEDNCQNCIGTGLEMLTQYNEGRESFVRWIVTGDKTRLHYWMLECESISMVWKMTDKTVPQMFKEKPSTGKVLATIFWDHKGVLALEYCRKVLL